MHFEVRKRVRRELTIFSLKHYEVIISSIVSTRRKVSSFLTSKDSCEQPTFHIEMGSMSLPRKFHHEHNDKYCDFPGTLLWDGYCLKCHS